MPGTLNLTSNIKKQLPPELVELLNIAGETANKLGQTLYLVGGVVRDLLLERTNFDLDLVVEGNAIDLAQKLVETRPGKIAIHSRFSTAKIQWHEWSVDLATARSETYAKPGALPAIKPGSLKDDLLRRDFTINAMAICLSPAGYGELVDPIGGREDLRNKLIRVLHDGSFIDDATRILRGLRYEQRLNFQLEPITLKLLKRDVAMLDTISGDRLRYELEMILKESYPENIIRRAGELQVLARLQPALEGNGRLKQRFTEARELTFPDPPPAGLYLALCTNPLTVSELERFISRLKLAKNLGKTLRDAASIKARLRTLDDPELAPSRIYSLLHDYSPFAIMANLLTADSPTLKQHIRLYLDRLRYVRTALSGDDLKRMGIAPGPRIKEILTRLHQAKLDGKVKSKQGEEEMVRGWIDKNNKW